MISHKKYELLLDFFKKDLKRCGILTNETSTANFCVNCKTREWVLIEKIKYDTIFYNPKYFDNFLFKIFDVPQYDSIDYPYLIKNLLFNSVDVLNEIFYFKFEDGYIKHKIITSTISDKVSVIENTVDLIIERLREQNYDGDFIK